MGLLIAGLLLFLGAHSVRIVADEVRSGFIARRGAGLYKALFSLASLAGLLLIVWGYGQARQAPVALWAPPPAWTRHLAGLLMLPALVLLVASQLPGGNQFKARLGHPMLLGVLLWAGVHLLANHTRADALLFGSFALWALLDGWAARARDRRLAQRPLPVRSGATALAVGGGVALWVVIAFWAHAALIGVRPFG